MTISTHLSRGAFAATTVRPASPPTTRRPNAIDSQASLVAVLGRLENEARVGYSHPMYRHTVGSLSQLMKDLAETPLASIVLSIPGHSLASVDVEDAAGALPDVPATSATAAAASVEPKRPAAAGPTAEKSSATYTRMSLSDALNAISVSTGARHEKAAHAAYLLRQCLYKYDKNANWLTPNWMPPERSMSPVQAPSASVARPAWALQRPTAEPSSPHKRRYSDSDLGHRTVPAPRPDWGRPDLHATAQDEPMARQPRPEPTPPARPRIGSKAAMTFETIPARWLEKNTTKRNLSSDVVQFLRGRGIDVPTDFKLVVPTDPSKSSYGPLVRQHNMQILLALRTREVSDIGFCRVLIELNQRLQANAVHTSEYSLRKAQAHAAEHRPRAQS